MKTERQKMLDGELYDAMDPELVSGRTRARDLCQARNAMREVEAEMEAVGRRRLLGALFGAGGDSVWMQPPFFCAWGTNIELGERVFFNFNCVVLNVCRVHNGGFTLFGPAVQIYTATHPFNGELRRREEFRQARAHRIGRVGGWRRDHPARRADRLARGDRRPPSPKLRRAGRQRGDAGCAGGRVCCRQSLPGDPRDHGMSAGHTRWTKTLDTAASNILDHATPTPRPSASP